MKVSNDPIETLRILPSSLFVLLRTCQNAHSDPAESRAVCFPAARDEALTNLIDFQNLKPARTNVRANTQIDVQGTADEQPANSNILVKTASKSKLLQADRHLRTKAASYPSQRRQSSQRNEYAMSPCAI
ncbi:hypothetical protein N2605_27040 [Bradyrhizobium yuanmingense]|uniref:hypothetical protein n=1 Tax=Bradyrhizobium yuanmingense TaxID=108015 RepID=UPI0021A26EDB|nr:hypothetical protein [Bradyrhizobium sp. CB1024]UWU83178.1 hypothetical protein N2605_27040 [Bradyrhizobium sp. CB1024]